MVNMKFTKIAPILHVVPKSALRWDFLWTVPILLNALKDVSVNQIMSEIIMAFVYLLNNVVSNLYYLSLSSVYLMMWMCKLVLCLK